MPRGIRSTVSSTTVPPFPSWSSRYSFGAPPATGYTAAPPAASAAVPVASSSVPPAVMAAIQRSKMIGAIKIYRELAGAGLREAKLYLRLPPGGSSSETPYRRRTCSRTTSRRAAIS